MNKALAAIITVAFSSISQAQMTPVGSWQTVDDKTGELKSEIRIAEANGVLTGTIAKVMAKKAKPGDVCDKCDDDRKDRPIVGLQIIRGAKKAEGKDVWEGGKVLDPENGSVYALRLTPIEEGKKLEVRGSIGPFGRTQTWLRIK